jgi:hypothetical protein
MRDRDRRPADAVTLVPPAPTWTLTAADSSKPVGSPGSRIRAKTGGPLLSVTSSHDGWVALIVTLYVGAVIE